MENKAHFSPLICPRKILYALVISRYKDDIIVITQDQGGAEVECNSNDIIQVAIYRIRGIFGSGFNLAVW